MPPKEGSLEAPTRHPIDWKSKDFYNQDALNKELERVFDLCHGCRRCVSLCNAFPTLFDLVDENPTMEVEGVDKADYQKVVDSCYLCDLCFMTKCPYIPPHEWNIDFPHLMLRAKAVKFQKEGAKLRDKIMTSTDAVSKTIAKPLVAPIINAAAKTPVLRKALDYIIDIDQDAWLPPYTSKPLIARLKDRRESDVKGEPAGSTSGKVALFATCYSNFNEPHHGEDLVAVFEHNNIPVTIAEKERCCGMPKLELGDLEAVDKLKKFNIPILARLVDQGWDILAPVPSCALMFRQELPLMYPDDADVQKVAKAVFDPFEYLMLREKAGKFNSDFKSDLGKVAYHVACHQRVQNIGPRTRQALEMVPGTEVTVIERCSGHDGTYAMKSEHRKDALKILRPVTRKVDAVDADNICSDCPMAAHHIAANLENKKEAAHPISLLRRAYDI